MAKTGTIIALLVIAAIMLWYLSLPALVVLSLIPQIKTPPINYVSSAPAISTTTLVEAKTIIPLDIYQPKGKPRGSLIIFHAAIEEGKDDPRLVHIAKVFARAKLKVYAPTLSSISREVFHPDLLGEMKGVIKYATTQDPELPLTLMSFSIAVGPELIVASDQEIAKDVALVVGFGGYLDSENVIRYHTTGFYQVNQEFKKGHPPDPFGVWLFARYYAQFLPENDAKAFYEIAERKWRDINAGITRSC